MDEKDYYGMLGVPKNATASEIRAAFNRKALRTHPDKSSQIAAGTDMALLNEAKTVLLDAEKRRLYDQYGILGLSMLEQRGKKKTTREILEELDRENKKKMMSDITSTAGASSTTALGFDATRVAQRKGFAWPRFESFSISKYLTCKPTDRFQMDFGVTAGMKQRRGGLQVTPAIVHLSGQYEFSRSVTGIVSVKKAMLAPCTVGAALSARISPTVSGLLQIEGNIGESGQRRGGTVLARGVQHFSETSALYVQLRSGAVNHFETGLVFEAGGMSFDLKCETNLVRYEDSLGMDPRVSLSTSKEMTPNTEWKAELAMQADRSATLQFGFGVTVLDYTKIGVFAQLGSDGASIILKYSRLGHKLQIPIRLAAEWMPQIAFLCAAAPCLFMAFAKVMLRLCEDQNTVVRDAALHQARYHQHLKDVDNLRQEADEKVKMEPHGGLVITRANYGNFKAAEEDQTMYRLVIDVTIPIRAKIKNRAPRCGSIEIGRMSKSGLPGFFDTDPGQPKHLEVWYTLAGVMYYVKVADTEKLQIPKPEHRVAGPSSGDDQP